MSKRRAAFVLAVVMLASVTALRADHDKGKHGKGHDDRWEQRDGFEYRTFEGDERPPGWGQGKKTGWGNCRMPPGQAKKYGCRTYVHEGRQYYYHQEGGRIIVRRPVVEIHGSVVVR